MKWPPSPVNRVPSAASLRYQLSFASGPALTRYRVLEVAAAPPKSARSFASSGANRRLKPTISRSLPVLVIASAIVSVSSRVSASGFSTKTALPVSSARHTSLACVACRVTMKIASRLSSSKIASVSVDAVSNPNFFCALTADIDLVVATCASDRGAVTRQVRQQHGRGVISRADEADRTSDVLFPLFRTAGGSRSPRCLLVAGRGASSAGCSYSSSTPTALSDPSFRSPYTFAASANG